jgi:ketosteroid isomerase-like protein
MKRKNGTLMLLLALSVIAIALPAQSAPATSDLAAIRAARVAQNAAMAAGDVERAAGWWTDDVAIRRGLGSPVNGIAAYKAILERAPVSDTALVYDRVTTGVSVSDHWPLAFETGTWTARRGGKGPTLITGQYSAQWVKRGGKWLIRGEIFVALNCKSAGCESKALP